MSYIQLLIGLRRNALLVVLGPLVLGLAAFATTYLLPPVYETEAKLAIVKNGSLVSFDPKYRTVSEIDSAGIDQTARRKSLVSLAKTFALASQVINKIDVQLDSTDREPANLLNEVTATIDGDLISIKVRSNDPQRAALIANTWTELYSVQANQLYGENALTTADLQAQLDDSKRDYDAKERALSDYLANNSIDLLTRQITQTQQHIDDLVTLDNKIERLLTDATSLRSKVLADPTSSGRADDLALMLLGASAFSTWSDLPVSLQIPIDQLSPGSSLSDRQRGLDTVIAILTERRIGIRAELNGSLHQEVNALKAQLEQANARKRELTGARDISEAALTTLSNKLSEVRVTESSKASVVKIASAAVAPLKSVSNRLSITLAAALVGLALGVSAAFAASFGKDFLARANEVRIEADLPLLATIPEANLSLKNGTAQTHEQSLPFRDAPHSRVSEAFRVLRYSLQLASPPSRVFMVASTLQGEGRTFVAANLAAAFAETGRRVILLDADMRHPSLHRVFSAPHNVGLSDLLNDRASSVEDTLQLTSIKDLWLMPAGSKPMDSIKLLESRAFELIVNKLKAMADVVIVDVPETLGLVDSIVVARLVDSALLVVQNREGLQSAVLRAKQILQAAGTRINGIVLNRGTQLQGYAAEVREGRLQSESVPGHLSN